MLAGVLALLLLGMPPNLLSIFLILRAKQPKSTTTYFLFNLAIADIVNLSASLLTAVLELLSTQDGKALWTTTVTSKAVANVTLALIALERYNGLVKTMAPFVTMGKGKVKIILGVTWSVCIVSFMPAIVYAKLHNTGEKGTFVVIYYACCTVISFIVPLVVVGYCYGKILKGVSHVSHGATILAQNPANETATEEKKRFIRIMVVVAVVFMACNLPAVVVKMLLVADQDVTVSRGLKITLTLLGCISSAVNPYIYGLHSKRYREQLRELFRCEHSEDEVMNVHV